MRKSSKALSLILSGLMATSCFSMAAVSASAAEVDSDAAGAKWVTAQERLDAGHQLVFFQFPDTVWGSNSNVKYNKKIHTTNVCCDYYAIYGANTEIKGAAWQAPSTSTFKDSSDSSLYYFDLTTGGRGEIEEGADYGILFSTQANKGQAGLLQPNAEGYQTCDLYFNSDCLGQTWVIDIPAVTRENTANSQKIDYYGHSQNNISQPIKKISTLCAYIDGIHPGGAPNGLELANGLKTYLPNPVNEPSFIWSKIQPTLEKFNTTAEEVYQCYVDKYAEDYNKGEHYEHVDGKDDLKADGTLKDCYRYTHYTTTEVDEGTGVAVVKDNKFPDFDLVRERLNLPDEQPVQIIDDVDLATTTDFSPGQPVPAATAFESNDERYTVQNVTITPADETFAYGTVYTLTYEAVAADGYAFDESTGCGLTNNFPDSAAAMEISSAINDGVLTVTVTMTMPEEPTTEAPETVCVVAGSPADIFGTAWDATNEANTMTKAEDGTFTKEFTVDKAYDAVQLKTVVDGADWIGDKTGNNVTFNLTGAGTFTVVYDPVENYTYVTGDIVEEITEFVYETVYAVGNGEGYWLNGAAWDPAFAANEMTQVADGVWEIEFKNVPDGFERQIKFAIDGAWTHNFGGLFEDSGVVSAAEYNGDNVTFDTDATCTVKAQLDLSNFNFATKEGAAFTVTITYDEEDDTTAPVVETTEAPVEETTEAPVEETTEAPVEETTEAPVEETTEAPVEETTEAPVEETTEAPVEDTVIVAGSPADIFGTAWDGVNDANTMTKAEDGTYTKDYTVDSTFTGVQLKSVVNGATWVGDKTGNNVTFNVTGAGTFTVIYHPATEGEDAYTEVVGDNVQFDTNLDYETVFAVGNGEGYWLNGAAWDPAFAQNEMTQVSEDVWEIEFTNVPDGFERQIKFAVDGAWTHNFGGAFEDSGVTSDAVYDGDNITFDTDATCTVKAQLDLTNFDYTTKEGAKFTVTITYDEDDKEVVGMIGDVNGDGEITIDDATLIQRRAVELEVFTDVQEQLADVNGDGRISILDVTCVQKYLAEFADGKGNTGKTLWSDGTISVG